MKVVVVIMLLALAGRASAGGIFDDLRKGRKTRHAENIAQSLQELPSFSRWVRDQARAVVDAEGASEALDEGAGDIDLLEWWREAVMGVLTLWIMGREGQGMYRNHKNGKAAE